MKTQLIQLDAFDDITSARDKLLWSQASRVLVVFPSSRKIVFSLIDLLVLFRQGQRQGAQVAFVTSDGELRQRLERLEVPVFRTVSEANLRRWRTTRKFVDRGAYAGAEKRQPDDLHALRTPLGGKRPLPTALRTLYFLMGLLAFLTIPAFFLPHVHIRLAAEQQEQAVTLALVGNPEVRSVQLNGAVPLYEVSAEVSGELEGQATGALSLPEDKAHGSVSLTNLTTDEVRVPDGTVFSTLTTPPVRVRSLADAVLLAGVGVTASVPVEAVLPGEAGNVESGAIRAIEGALGLLVAVNNPEALAGGQQSSVPAPTETDLQTTRAVLLASLDVLARTALEKVLVGEQRLIIQSLERVEILEETARPRPGEPGQAFTVRISARYHAWVYDQNDVRLLAQTILNAGLPDTFRPVGTDLAFRPLGDPVEQAGQYTWQVVASRPIARGLAVEDLVRLVSGREPEDAAQLIAAHYSLEQAPDVQLDPPWWPFLPFMSFQYTVGSVE